MKNEPNQKIELTPKQQNPYLARPEDFSISTAAQASRRSMPGHGQNGESRRELSRLLNDPRRPPHSGHGQELPQRKES